MTLWPGTRLGAYAIAAPTLESLALITGAEAPVGPVR